MKESFQGFTSNVCPKTNGRLVQVHMIILKLYGKK